MMVAGLFERVRSDRQFQRILVATVVLLVAVVPLVTNAYLAELAFIGMVFVMLGVSWNLIAGYAGQISLGHVAFFGIAAYVSAWMTTPDGAGLPEFIAVSPVVAILVGGFAAAVIAALLGPIMFRLRGHYFAIGTLALAAIVQELLVNQRGLSGGASGYYVDGTNELFIYYVGLAATLLTVFGTYYVVNSRLGLGMRAVKGDEDAADSLGVNTLKYKIYAFVVSSFFAGLAGGAYAQYTLYLNPESTLSVVWTIDALVIVVLGGMATIHGPILGAGLFLVIDNALAEFAGTFATTIEGAIIILFIIFLPEGLYGYITETFDEPVEDGVATETPVEGVD